MSRDKHIEEMAKDILKCGCVGTCLECEYATLAEDDCACIDVKIAEGLYNAGYRKSTEVAEEIFEEIAHIGGCSRGIFLNSWDYAELKKKYTEGGE